MSAQITIQNKIVNLSQLGKDFTKSVLYKSMSVPASRLASAMRFLAPEETGALKLSIGYKIGAYPGTGTAFAVVGPRKNYRLNGRRPTKYAHLVEFGHAIVQPKNGTSIRKKTATVTGRVAAKPFVRPAVLAMRQWGASELSSQMEKNLKITVSAREAMTRST